jgi:hypothetical protein
MLQRVAERLRFAERGRHESSPLPLDETSIRRRSRRRLVALGFCCTLTAFLCAAPASAQVRRPAPQGSPRGGGVLQKLESFQSSVKRRLKSALGVEAESPAASTAAPPNQTAATPTRQPAGELRRQPGSDPMIPDLQPGWQGGGGGAVVQQAAGMQPAAQPAGQSAALPPVAVAAAEPGFGNSRSVASSADAAHRRVDYQQVAGEMPRYSSPAEPLPPPVPQQSAPSPQQWNDPNDAAPPASQAPANRPPAPRRAGVAPAARGTVLGGNPVTATEHALRLLEENGDLKTRVAMMEAEHARLKEKLAQTQAMLQRSSVAIEQAKQEIDNLVSENRQLTGKLREAETRYNRHLMETDRMLQSIRDELDDVLVREISATGR